MKLKELLLEETAFIVLKRGILGNVIMVGLVNGKEGNKITPFEEIDSGLKKRFLGALKEKYSDETNVELYVKNKAKNPVKFSMIGARLRLINDGK